MDPLNILPTTLYGGETIVESITVNGYTPATHTLSYHFALTTALTVAAVANSGGTGWDLTVTAAQTVLWPSGSLAFMAYATASTGGRVTVVDAGAIQVTASPAFTSWAKTALAAVEAKIAGRASEDQTNFSIGDISVGLMSFEALTKARDWLKTEASKDGSNRVARVIRTVFR